MQIFFSWREQQYWQFFISEKNAEQTYENVYILKCEINYLAKAYKSF